MKKPGGELGFYSCSGILFRSSLVRRRFQAMLSVLPNTRLVTPLSHVILILLPHIHKAANRRSYHVTRVCGAPAPGEFASPGP